MGAWHLPLCAELSRWERLGLAVLAILAIGFGLLVEVRAAFLHQHRSDLPIYLGAARAVRSGGDPYDFLSERSCHYNYPPLLAILLTPLAGMAPAMEGPADLAFALVVALWYGLGILAVLGGIHVLANSLEQQAAAPVPCGCRRWWALRVVPLVICLPGVMRTLSLGQVDLIILGLLCGTAAAAVRGRSWRAGLWLSGAVCLKFLPAFLLLYPLARRDWRWLAGCAAGVAVGWGLVPAAVWGPARAWQEQRRWAEVVVLPGLGLGSDHSRDYDLTSLQAVNSQSLIGVLHNFAYPDHAARPAQAGTAVKGAALLVGAVLVLLTLAGACRRPSGGLTAATALGCLLAILLLLAPVCHPHYLCHWLPLVAALLAWDMERHANRALSIGLLVVFALNLAGSALTSVPGLEVLRDFGSVAAAGLLLWSAGVAVLWRRAPDQSPRIGLRGPHLPTVVRSEEKDRLVVGV
jgi:hypothetical protein